MRTVTTDILVVGAGGAGLRAALSAREAAPEADITVISKGEPGSHGLTATACSDRMAFHVSFPFTPPGGELAWQEHAKDIYERGGYVSDPNLAKLIARESADAYRRLAGLGVPFATGPGNRPQQFVTDGSKYPRACFTGPYTARDIEHALLGAAGKSNIRLTGNLSLISVITAHSPSRAVGALCTSANGNELLAIGAKAIILATGGPGAVYRHNVYPDGMDGTVWWAALRAGASLVNTEFIQFGLASPATSLACSGSLMRAIPRLTADGRDLLPDVCEIEPDHDPIELLFRKGASWPVSAESPTRAVDIAVWRACASGGKVLMDYRENPPFADADHLNKRLSEIIRVWYKDRGVLLAANGNLSKPIERLRGINPQVIEWFAERGVDLSREPIEIRHCAQHFQGGILINTRAETGIAGLYACGEVAGGQHGASRPGGNSLLDCQVMGHIAGTGAAMWASIVDPPDIIDLAENESRNLRSILDSDSGLDPDEVVRDVGETLSTYLGVMRTPSGMEKAEAMLADLARKGVASEAPLFKAISACSSVMAGLGITRAAMMRKESRGSHLYFNNEEERKPVLRNEQTGRVWHEVTWDGGDIRISLRSIPHA